MSGGLGSVATWLQPAGVMPLRTQPEPLLFVPNFLFLLVPSLSWQTIVFSPENNSTKKKYREFLTEFSPGSHRRIAAGVKRLACRDADNALLFLNFSYVCPEPVLVNDGGLKRKLAFH